MNDETKPADRTLFSPDDGVLSDTKPPIPAPRRPGSKAVTTLTLSSRTCKWPIGDPAAADFHYCGRPPQSGRPYCDAHDRMSYQTPSRKKAAPSFR